MTQKVDNFAKREFWLKSSLVLLKIVRSVVLCRREGWEKTKLLTKLFFDRKRGVSLQN